MLVQLVYQAPLQGRASQSGLLSESMVIVDGFYIDKFH